MNNLKRGQIQLSFGMIFSIIIIIATLAVGFYVITYFLDLSKCNDIGTFYYNLGNDVKKAWEGDITQKVFTGKLPSNLEQVCFGNFTQMVGTNDRTEFDELRRYSRSGRNVYLYPPGKACDNPSYTLEHIKTEKFFCVPVKSGAVSVKLTKGSADALVTLSAP